MLMKPEKKKMASLILGSASASPMDELKSKNEELMEAPQMDEGLLAAAEEMISAMQANDVQGLAQALQSFLDMHQAPAQEQE